MANALMAYRRGILAWYDCQISTAKVKGIDNKIKVFKRVAYGFYRSEVLQPKTLCLASLLHHAECRMNQNVLMYRIRHNPPLGSYLNELPKGGFTTTLTPYFPFPSLFYVKNSSFLHLLIFQRSHLGETSDRYTSLSSIVRSLHCVPVAFGRIRGAIHVAH